MARCKCTSCSKENELPFKIEIYKVLFCTECGCPITIGFYDDITNERYWHTIDDN